MEFIRSSEMKWSKSVFTNYWVGWVVQSNNFQWDSILSAMWTVSVCW